LFFFPWHHWFTRPAPQAHVQTPSASPTNQKKSVFFFSLPLGREVTFPGPGETNLSFSLPAFTGFYGLNCGHNSALFSPPPPLFFHFARSRQTAHVIRYWRRKLFPPPPPSFFFSFPLTPPPSRAGNWTFTAQQPFFPPLSFFSGPNNALLPKRAIGRVYGPMLVDKTPPPERLVGKNRKNRLFPFLFLSSFPCSFGLSRSKEFKFNVGVHFDPLQKKRPSFAGRSGMILPSSFFFPLSKN